MRGSPKVLNFRPSVCAARSLADAYALTAGGPPAVPVKSLNGEAKVTISLRRAQLAPPAWSSSIALISNALGQLRNLEIEFAAFVQ